MSHITSLKQCKTLDDLFILTSARLTLQSCRWGGWTISDGTASYSSYQLTLKLNELFRKSLKNRKTANTTLKIADRIHQINRAARQCHCPWYRILFTLIRLWIENLTYHHHRILITVTEKAHSILKEPPPQKKERSLLSPFSSDILDDEPDNLSLADTSEELEYLSSPKDILANPYTLNINELKGKRQMTEAVPIFCKFSNENILTFSMTDYKHATVKSFLKLAAAKCSAPVEDLRFYFKGCMLNQPDHFDKLLSQFDFRTAGESYLIVRKAGTSQKIDDFLKQSAMLSATDYSCLGELEASLIRLETAVLKNSCPQFDSDVSRIEDALKIISQDLKQHLDVLEAIQELQEIVDRTRNLSQRGLCGIAESWKTVFEQIVEEDLKLYLPITCEAKADEPTFKLTCNNHHCIFHREALQSQIGNGPLAEYLTNRAQSEIVMNIDPELFSCLTAYLYDGNAPQSLDRLSEAQLVEFYEIAFQLLIPRLEIQCALEIMEKAASSNWNNHDLLIPYLDRDETVLGKMMKIYG